MNVVTLKDIPNLPMEGAEPFPGYTGPVSRSRQPIIQPGEVHQLQLQRRQLQPGLHDRVAYA